MTTRATSPSLIQRLDQLAQAAVAAGEIPGLALAVVNREGTDFARGYGVAGNATSAPITAQTIFEAASLSKPVVALTTLILAGQRILDLDRPLDDYLPAPYLADDPRGRAITARHVLGHTTGLPNWRPRGQALALVRDPQTRFGYSGEGYVYLQRAIEQLTQSTLDQTTSQHVFNPLKMVDSTFVWRSDLEPRTALGHDKSGASVPKDKPTNPNAAWSLHTTAPDLARFAGAFLNPALERPAPIAGAANAMLTPHTAVEGPLSWGLGWGLCDGAESGIHFWHWGDNFGYKAFIAGSTQSGLGIVVLTNGNAGLATAERLVVEPFPKLRRAFDALRSFGQYLT